MWWYFTKKSDGDKKYVYLFAFEAKDITGELKYDKTSRKINIIKYA